MVNTSTSKHSENGSAHVWLVAVLVVIIIALLGVVFWQHFKKTDTVNTSPQKEVSKVDTSTQPTTSTTSTYTSTDPGTYVKSFTYPSSWHVVTPDDMCQKFNFCASPPVVALASNGSIYLAFYTPQAASDATIDEQAASVNNKGGTIVKGFTSLDGVDARKVEHPNGDVSVIVALRGGYGEIDLTQANPDDINTVLSTWKWA